VPRFVAHKSSNQFSQWNWGMYTMLSDNRSLPQLVYTVEEAASILKVSNKTVYRLVDRNLLHASKALRHLRITKKSLEQFLATTSGEEVSHE
jgi:excisionase family DNA binding protein